MRRTILLADDSPTIHRLVNNTFADADFEIVSVSNGDAAIRKFEEIHPHVVLADIYMPVKTGYEVCAHIRKHPTVGATPVILLVGAFDVFDESKAKEIGATANITKPFEPQALVSLIESVLPPEEVVAEDYVPPEDRTLVIAAGASPVAQPVSVRPPAQPAPPASAVPGPPKADVTAKAGAAAVRVDPPEDDLLGLEALFPSLESLAQSAGNSLTEADLDRIADRVIQRLSTQVIESIAWEIVPDITERVLREEVKRHET